MYFPLFGASMINFPSAPPATALSSFKESVKSATVGYSILLPDVESTTIPVIVIFVLSAF